MMFIVVSKEAAPRGLKMRKLIFMFFIFYLQVFESACPTKGLSAAGNRFFIAALVLTQFINDFHLGKICFG